MIEENFSSQAKNFFDKHLLKSNLGECSLFLCRKDGGVLYKHGPIAKSVEPDSICVLMSGAWQAAETVSMMASKEKKLRHEHQFFDRKETT